MLDQESLRRLLAEGVSQEIFSGAQAAVVIGGEIVGPVAVGHTAYADSVPAGSPRVQVEVGTRFDLASLTKAVVTAPLTWLAISQGVLRPDEHVARWLPDWGAGVRRGVTVRQLLNHTSGLPAWAPLYEEAMRAAPRAALADEARCVEAARQRAEAMRGQLMSADLEHAPGVEARYSDLGYMLLGVLLERALGRPLDELARAYIFDPLGMSRCRFVRLSHGARLRQEVAATEATEVASHGASLSGVVHDENAWAMGGVAGHAGLFGVAEDLARFAQALMAADGGVQSGWSITPSALRWAMSARAATTLADGRRLGSHLGGLDTPSGARSTAGPHVTVDPVGATVGHLGFTGTSLWLDRSRQAAWVLLTNRVHPTRQREGIRDYRVRFHEVLTKAAPVVPGWRPWPEVPELSAPGPIVGFDSQRALDVAVTAALRAGSLARHIQGRDLQIVHKGDVDLVTQADLESEATIVGTLRAAFPEHSILTEEEGASGRDDARCRWIIDPIDGTTNFSHRNPHFCVCIALEVEGQLQVGVVYDPVRDELFTARRGHGAWLNGRRLSVSSCRRLERALVATGFPYDRRTVRDNNVAEFAELILHVQGVRRAGAAGLDMAYVAAGRLDLYWEKRLKPWDVAAGLLLVEEAGGRVTDMGGEPFDRALGDVIASAGPLHSFAVSKLIKVAEARTSGPSSNPT